MSDLIRRIDAMQACQVAPSDEWSKATKGGYNQAATDCAMALLKCEPVPPTLSAAMELPEVRAMVGALERECALTQAQVDRMLVNSTKMDANITTLTEAAARVLHDIDDIVANSEGVAGLHMNGEVAEWHSLMSGGSFEAWLRSVEVLRAALTPTADKEPKT